MQAVAQANQFQHLALLLENFCPFSLSDQGQQAPVIIQGGLICVAPLGSLPGLHQVLAFLGQILAALEVVSQLVQVGFQSPAATTAVAAARSIRPASAASRYRELGTVICRPVPRSLITIFPCSFRMSWTPAKPEGISARKIVNVVFRRWCPPISTRSHSATAPTY